MKIFILSFFYFLQNITSTSTKHINNIYFPACRNCVHFRPSLFGYDYTFSKCTNFGTKNMIDNTITYDFVDSCRENESKCGKEGKYYEMDKNADTRLFLYTMFRNIPNLSIISTIIIIFGRNK